MELSQLAPLLERSDTHRKIVGDYKGPYALGIGQDPDHPGTYGFILKVPTEEGWPRSVTINGQQIPVHVQGGFRRVVPL